MMIPTIIKHDENTMDIQPISMSSHPAVIIPKICSAQLVMDVVILVNFILKSLHKTDYTYYKKSLKILTVLTLL